MVIKITNDTNTLNGALTELGETLADNLVSMGVVDASASDGLTTLAGKVLNIEPSIGGLDLDTAVSLSASSSSIISGQSVVLTSKLTASYDDETLVDVDLHGVLQGAIVLFKEGNTTIGSAITGSDGVCTCTVSNLAVGSHTLKAVFEGTENFNECASTTIIVIVNAPSVDSISITGDNNPLMVGESCMVTCTALDSNNNPIPNVSMSISVGGSVVKTENTDANGEVSYTYTGVGAGDVIVSAECMSVQETFSIEDLYYYNSGDHIDDLSVDSGVSISSDGSVITIGSSSGEKYVKLPTGSITGDFRMETTIADSPNTTYNCAWICSSSTYGAINRTNANATIGGTGMGTISFDTSINGVLKLEYINGTLSVYFNNVLIGSKAINLSNDYIGYFTNTGRTQKLKDIKFVYL